MKAVMTLILIAASFLLFTPQALALDIIGDECTKAGNPDLCADKSTGTSGNPLLGADGIITTAIRLLSILVGVAAVVAIIISGIKFMTSAGDASSASSARRALLYAVIALATAVSAQGIVTFVLSKL